MKTFAVLAILGALASALAEPIPALTYAKINMAGACPIVQAIANVDLAAVTGQYFRVRSNRDIPGCYENQCQTMYSALYDGPVIQYAVCCRSAETPSVPACGVSIGSGTVTGTNTTGLFTYQSGAYNSDMVVLDTDYTDYTVIYGCRPHGFLNLQRDELLYVYSRTFSLSKEVLDKINTVFERNHINPAQLRDVRQGRECPYNPMNLPQGN